MIKTAERIVFKLEKIHVDYIDRAGERKQGYFDEMVAYITHNKAEYFIGVVYKDKREALQPHLNREFAVWSDIKATQASYSFTVRFKEDMPKILSICPNCRKCSEFGVQIIYTGTMIVENGVQKIKDHNFRNNPQAQILTEKIICGGCGAIISYDKLITPDAHDYLYENM